MSINKFKNSFLRNKNIVTELTKKSIKNQYRNSFLGMIWSILTPLLNTLIMYIVFKEVLKNNDQFFVLYLLCGNILFQALRSSTMNSLSSIVANRGLLLKMKIKEEVFPLSAVFASITNFGFSLIALFIVMVFLQIKYGVVIFGYQIIFVILLVPSFIMFVYGIGLVLSALFVFFRDIQQIYAVFLTLWTYLTPIFYKVNVFSQSSFVLKIIRLNPMYYFIDYFRDCVYALQLAGSNAAPSFLILINTFVIGLMSTVIGLFFFKLLRKKFMYYI